MSDAPVDAADTVAFLQSDAAAAALADLTARATREAEALRLIEALRRRFAPWQAAALLSQARLRQRAAAKWPFAHRLLLVDEALEQATAWPVALHRARRLHALAPPGPILDLGAGIGGDTLALATLRPVVAFERDPLRAAFLHANVAALTGEAGLPSLHPVEVRCEEWTAAFAAGALPPAAAAFADPARRTAAEQGAVRRVYSLHAMQPPLGALPPLLAQVPLLAVKVAPGVDEAELPPGAALEIVSHERTAKEGVLWLGPAAEGLPHRWASVHDGAIWHELAAGGGAAPALAADEAPQPGQIVWEPDPAVVRAGALDTLCAHVDGRLFAPDIAYVVSDGPPAATPFASPFRLIEAAPFALKRLNQRLAALEAGTLEIKKRGFPIEPETLRTRLKWQPAPGGRPITVLLTRRGDAHWMMMAERLQLRIDDR